MPEQAGDFRVLQRRFAAHLRDPLASPAPAGIDDRRLAVYRDLFFNNVLGLVSGSFPVLRSMHEAEAWQALVRDWYRDHRAQTPLFPQVGAEFVDWLLQRQQADTDPAWVAELAHYEWMEVVAANDDNDLAAVAHRPDGDLLEEALVLSPLAWPLVYRYPVQRIRADSRPHAQPPDRPTCLVIVRDRDDRVGFLEANPLTLRLIEILRTDGSLTGREVLATLADELGLDRGVVLVEGASLLERLRQRDIVLGTRPA